MSKKRRVRVIALGVFRQRNRVFVTKAYDPAKDQVFYRPLGGRIEFGERGAETVARELREEIGAEVRDLRYLATFENIFTYNGETGHEIVLLYEGAFADPDWYGRDVEKGREQQDDPPLMQGVWVALDEFGPGIPLYPDGLLEVLTSAPRSIEQVLSNSTLETGNEG
jgi:8-oxo-dGTP pyrophosphatase MutT (NUDIX family)